MSGYTTNGLTVWTMGQTSGAEQAAFDTQLTAGGVPESVAIGGNALGLGWQTVAAAGASAGTATALPSTTAYNVMVTVTASTEGVKLPAAATGLRFLIMPSTTVGVKVYANAAGQSIGTGTTNTTAVTVALNTATKFLAVSKTKWRVA